MPCIALATTCSCGSPAFLGAPGGVEHEHEWLPRLAPLLPVAIPVLLGKGAPAEGYPWSWSPVMAANARHVIGEVLADDN